MKDTLVWECKCGHIEYGENPPEECGRCDSLNSFFEVPEDMVDEKVEGNILANRTYEEEELED